MKSIKILIFSMALSICSLLGKAQSIKQFNGQFAISFVNATGGNGYQINGTFTDVSNTYTAAQARVGDRIIDGSGNTFEILTITIEGTLISTSTKAFDAIPPGIGSGMIYRPSTSGFPMITVNTPSIVWTNVANTATMAIDAKIPKYRAGSALPASTGKIGDLIFNTGDMNLYRLTESGWIIVSADGLPLEFANPVTSAPAGEKGDLLRSFWDNEIYVFNGSTWVAPDRASELPAISKFGDVFFVTGEKKMYMMAENGKWVPISGSSIPGGPGTDFPSGTKPGDLYFNTDNNTLYVYDINKKWLEVSANGSTPSGSSNPNPATDLVKEGNLFYNTSDHKLYVYNGSSWLPMDLSLRSGRIFIGNSANVATGVVVSGDAALTSAGKLIIGNNTITNEKLDKANIPLNGFANPTEDISMGDGISNYRITNLATPNQPMEAANKNYVDLSLSNPNQLGLPINNLFVGNSLGKAVAVPKSSIPISDFDKALANINMGTFKIINLAEPNFPQDAATRNYVDTRVIPSTSLSLPLANVFVGNAIGIAAPVLKTAIPFSDFGKAAATVSMGGFNLTELAGPAVDRDAATKKYVDDKIISPQHLTLTTGNLFVGDANGKAADVLKSSLPLSGFGAALTDVLLGGFQLKNLGIPVLDGDAATKKYIDDLFKAPVDLIALPVGQFFVGNVNGKAHATEKKAISISGFAKAMDNLLLGDKDTQHGINFLAEPVDGRDATTKNYVDRKTSTPESLNLRENYILIGDTANKAAAIAKEAIPLSDFGSATTDIVFNKGTNFRITALADPKNDQDAATKKYVDSKTSKTPVGPTAPTNPVAGDTYYNTTDKHFYVYDGTKWVTVDIKTELKTGELFVGDATNTPVSTLKSDVPLSGFGEVLKDLAINKGASAFRITALADPKDDQDAATKKYVDSKGTQTSGTAPVNPKAGDTYYNTTDKHLYFYNGTDWIAIDTKDNLGNHKATQNIILGTNSISNDGLNGKGLSFDTNGNATFGQDVTVNANFYTPSDRRLKTNIETLSSVLQKINQIRGVSFQYINQHKYAAGPKIGVIAQELQQVYPEMVTKGKDGFLKVDYTQLTGMLIQAVKEQQQELEILKARMDKQQQQIDSILKRMQ